MNWEQKRLGVFAADAKIGERVRQRSQEYLEATWTSGDGTTRPVQAMSKSHLLYALAKIERGEYSGRLGRGEFRGNTRDALESELLRRLAGVAGTERQQAAHEREALERIQNADRTRYAPDLYGRERASDPTASPGDQVGPGPTDLEASGLDRGAERRMCGADTPATGEQSPTGSPQRPEVRMIPENETPKERRNRLQRARRAEPNRKEAEARATRRSYYKRTQCYNPSHLAAGYCSFCRDLQEQHDL